MISMNGLSARVFDRMVRIIGVCDGWKEFSEHFSTFVQHEGGGSESKDSTVLEKRGQGGMAPLRGKRPKIFAALVLAICKKVWRSIFPILTP